MALRHIVLDGKVYAWKQLLQLRREQRKAARQPEPTLFPLKEDIRPPSQRNASGRYAEPTLFDEGLRT